MSFAYVHAVRFVLRWPKRYGLVDELEQERPAWQFTRGKRSREHRLLWNARRRCYRKTGIIAVPVYDKAYHQPLWLVVARLGSGREPWYLLTNEPIHNAQDAWKVVLFYARCWNIEMSIRFDKCELGLKVHVYVSGQPSEDCSSSPPWSLLSCFLYSPFSLYSIGCCPIDVIERKVEPQSQDSTLSVTFGSVPFMALSPLD